MDPLSLEPSAPLSAPAGRPTLAGVPLFSNLSADQLERLGLRSRLISFERREAVFHEGDEASGLYVVARGRVKVYKVSPRGKEQILHLLGPGEPLGEVALFSGRTFPANAETVEPSLLFYVARRALIDLIHEDSEVALHMMAFLSARLRAFAGLIENLSLREVAGRLASFIMLGAANRLDLALGGAADGNTGAHAGTITATAAGSAASRPDTIDLDLSKTEMAALFGTVPETLSRAFRQLQDEGIIETQGRKIRVKDWRMLEKAAWTFPSGTAGRP